jgi:hypothetical protein
LLSLFILLGLIPSCLFAFAWSCQLFSSVHNRPGCSHLTHQLTHACLASLTTPSTTTLTLGTASKEQAQRPGTPALGRSAAPTWGPRWLPQHCGSHARTVVQCAHSGGVGLGTRPLVRSQRTVRRYPYPPGPLLSPTLGSIRVSGNNFKMAVRLTCRSHRP